jgi:sialidase-1
MHGKPGKHQWNGDGSEAGYELGKSAQLLMVRSRDDGKTWSKPENLTRLLKRPEWWLLTCSVQQGLQLPDGALVMPMQGRDEKGVPFATIMHSSDHGKSWALGEPAFSGGNECQAVPLGDGSIMLNVRNTRRTGYCAVAVTPDLGRTWSLHPTHNNTLIEPTCNASLLRIDYHVKGERRHALLFSNPQSKTDRTHHTLQVSFDDGMTWPEEYRLLLDEGRGFGYSSLTRFGDHIGIVYEGSRSQLVFERFSVDELLHRSRR